MAVERGHSDAGAAGDLLYARVQSLLPERLARGREAVSLGVSIGVLVMSTALAVRFRDHLPTVAAAVAAGAVSALMIIGTQVYVLATVKDLTFIEGLALGAIALIGLTAHELTGERVVHSLELRAAERQPGHGPVAA